MDLRIMKSLSTEVYGVITKDVSDYINLLAIIAHIICNHPLLLNKELRDFTSSHNIIRIAKFRRLRSVGHVAKMRKQRNIQNFSGKSCWNMSDLKGKSEVICVI